MIVSSNKGGLSNRIKSIVSCLRYAKKNNYKVKVYWEVLNSYKTHNHILNCTLDKLFDNLETIEKIPLLTETYDYPCLKIFDEDNVPENFCDFKPLWKSKFTCKDSKNRDILFSYNKMPPLAKQNYIPFFKQLKPIQEISSAIESFSKKFDTNTISVHIRSWCRPNEHSRASKLFVNGIKKFERQMLKYPNANFFLATDSTNVQNYFLNHPSFKDKIIIYNRSSNLENSRSLPLGIQEDLIELYLLSKNRTIIGSFNSTFTEVAWWLGGCTNNITII